MNIFFYRSLIKSLILFPPLLYSNNSQTWVLPDFFFFAASVKPKQLCSVLTLSLWNGFKKLPAISPSSRGVPGGLFMPAMLLGEFCRGRGIMFAHQPERKATLGQKVNQVSPLTFGNPSISPEPVIGTKENTVIHSFITAIFFNGQLLTSTSREDQ